MTSALAASCWKRRGEGEAEASRPGRQGRQHRVFLGLPGVVPGGSPAARSAPRGGGSGGVCREHYSLSLGHGRL